ncbi:MAG: hypothetical protein P8M22_10885 [Phycisphaerales bacterium]|nr:hypothetical protein [Phycisphaerales bacterium]
MKWTLAIVLMLVTASSASADYFAFFTRVSVEPELGRISVTRELVRSEKYVDWMHENAEALAKKGIFVDPEPGEGPITRVRRVTMDGQAFEFAVTSDHRSRRGMGSALPDVGLRVKIDGELRWDTAFGEFRGMTDLQKVVFFPADKLIKVEAMQYSVEDGWQGVPETSFLYEYWPEDKVFTGKHLWN